VKRVKFVQLGGSALALALAIGLGIRRMK